MHLEQLQSSMTIDLTHAYANVAYNNCNHYGGHSNCGSQRGRGSGDQEGRGGGHRSRGSRGRGG